MSIFKMFSFSGREGPRSCKKESVSFILTDLMFAEPGTLDYYNYIQ